MGDVTVPGDKTCAPLVPKVVDDLRQLRAHDGPLTRLIAQDVVVVSDLGHEVVELVDDLLAFQGGQAAQLHVEDGRRLHLIDLQETHQARAGIIDRSRRTDECDDLVECIQCLEIAAQDVCPLLRFAQAVAGAALDDLDLMGDPRPDKLLDAQSAWDTIDEGQHVGAEGLLQLCLLIEIVKDDLRDGIALQLNDESHARA